MKNPRPRKVVRHEATFDAPVEAVFPLLCPTREYEWIDGWSCDLVHSESGFAEKGAIFTTKFRPEGASIWTVSAYQPPRRIEFVIVFPESHVMVAELSLVPEGPGRTRLSWSCSITSLAERNPFVDGMDQESFDRIQAPFDRRLQHFLQTGSMLRTATG